MMNSNHKIDERLEINLKRWDELASIHFNSNYYDVDAFIKGKNTLKSIELNEVGNVQNRQLLHLQCHFGLDTLSWGRLGAHVMGVDFSIKAITLANELAKITRIKAKFLCSDINHLIDKSTPEMKNKFDIVFTSYGTITWLSDLSSWAKTINHFLKPGGFFYIIDSHPFSLVFNDEIEHSEEYKVGFSYFLDDPLEFNYNGSYADSKTNLRNKRNFQWIHSLSKIINSLANAGLKIEFLHEFPFTHYPALPFFEQNKDGWWEDKKTPYKIPLMFSLKAIKLSNGPIEE